jgi:3,4-dihydroxy 2-butanone 4-phosphate synthase/GTP cyclohydrolase II
MSHMPYAPIEEMVQALRRGELTILINDKQDNQGMLLGLAGLASAEMINSLITIGTGLTYVAITEQRAAEVGLSPMVSNNTNSKKTAFTVSVDAVGNTTGISASERAFTARMLCDPSKGAEDFYKPGHLFPLVSKRHGILERLDFTEAAIELANLCKAFPAGVLCEILDQVGSVASLAYIEELSARYLIPMMNISGLAQNCLAQKPQLQLTSREELVWDGIPYFGLHWTNPITGKKLVSLVSDVLGEEEAVQFVHTWDCMFGNLLQMKDRCSCLMHFEDARRRVKDHPAVVVIHHHYTLEDEHDTFLVSAYERQIICEMRMMNRV